MPAGKHQTGLNTIGFTCGTRNIKQD